MTISIKEKKKEIAERKERHREDLKKIIPAILNLRATSFEVY